MTYENTLLYCKLKLILFKMHSIYLQDVSVIQEKITFLYTVQIENDKNSVEVLKFLIVTFD